MGVSGDAVRVEVTDDAAHPPVLRRVNWDEESGRGLLLVDTLASRWGTEPVGAGKRVWFEV